MKTLLSVIFIFLFAQYSAAQLMTDFESDSLDGWRSEGDGSYYLENDFGNPGNSMRVDDDATGALNIAIAPVTYSGNWSAADSTDSILVDVFVSQISGSVLQNVWVFRLSGPGGNASSPAVTLVPGVWTHIAFPMDSSKWSLTSGSWHSLLEYINLFELRAEYINGDEFVRLDNIGLTFSPEIVPITPPVISDFENGLYGGWTFNNSGGTSIQTSGGNPGKYIRISDGTGLTEAFAPSKFLGDWTGLDESAAIMFDLKISNFTGPFIISDFLVQISGPGGQAEAAMDSSITTAFNTWKTFSVLISENDWNMKSGDWQSLIYDVRELRLVTEYIDGTEIVWFDNFRISNSAPIADFGADHVFIFFGDDVHFRDYSLNAPKNWLWEFGDGNTSTEAEPVHTYQDAGLYNVKLTVDNDFGSDEIEKTGYIEVMQTTDSILFADDFDDNKIHPAWNFMNGTWVEQNQTMAQTSNYYNGSYIGGCYAIVGSPVWKNYQLDVDFLSTDNDKIGVVFNYQDANNFYLFTWQQEGIHRAIKRFVNGIQTDLAVDTVGYETSKWYTLSISTMDYKITASLDSVEIFSIVDSTFSSGKAGLYCHGNQSSFWDNFKITNLDYVSDIAHDISRSLPSEFRLEQNYPNPFNPVTTIDYTVPAPAYLEINLFNTLGQKIKTLAEGKKAAGVYSIKLDADNLTSGVYFYSLITDKGYSTTRKLILIR